MKNPTSSLRVRCLGRWLVAVAGLGMCVALAAAAIAYPMHASLLTLALATALVCLVPFAVAAVRGRLDIFEPSVLVGFFYFVGFPLSALMALAFGPEFDPSLSFAWFPEALGVALIGVGAWLLGYYLGPGKALARPLPPISRGWSPSRAALAAGVFAVGGWAAQALFIVRGGYLHGFSTRVSLQWSTAASWVAGFTLVALALVAVEYFRAKMARQGSRLQGGIFLTLFVGELVYTVPTGSRLELLMTLLIPVMAATYVLGRVRWSWLVVLGGIVVFLVFPLENVYRQIVSEGAQINLVHPSTTSLGLLRHAAAATLLSVQRLPVGAYAMHSIRTFVERLNMIGIVAALVRWTPDLWPFQHGQTLQAFVVSLAPPRFLVQKPVVSVGGVEFAHLYRLIRASDTVTSVGPTRLGELYVNFWMGGVVAGMWVAGVLSRFVYEYLVGRDTRTLAGVVFYMLFVLVFAQFSAFADYALFLKTVVVVAAALAWVASGGILGRTTSYLRILL